MNTPEQDKLVDLLYKGVSLAEACARAGLGTKRGYQLTAKHNLPTNPSLQIGGPKLRSALVLEASGYTLEEVAASLRTAPCRAKELLNATRKVVIKEEITAA